MVAISIDKSQSKEKTKDCIIKNNASNTKLGSITNPIARIEFEGKEFLVDAEYMKQAMEKIIALNNI